MLAAWGCGESEFFEGNGERGPVFVESLEAESEAQTGGGLESNGGEQVEGRFEGTVGPGTDPALGAVGEQERSEQRRYETSRAVPSVGEAPLEVLEARGEAVEFGETIAVVRNVIDTAIPHAMYIYVHDGGGTVTSFESVQPGEIQEFVPAPKENPGRFVRHNSDVLVEKLVDAGVVRGEAERMVEEQAGRLFREHGRRVLYVAPNDWTEATGDRAFGAVEVDGRR